MQNKLRNIASFGYSFFSKYVVKPYSVSIKDQPLEISSSSKTKTFKTLKDMPGPKLYPIIGNLLDLKEFGGSLDYSKYQFFFNELQSRYGDIVHFKIMGTSQVFVFNPEDIKTIYQFDGVSPMRPELIPLKEYITLRGLPETLLLSNNEAWKKLRSPSNVIAAKPKNVSLYMSKHNEIVDEFINIIHEKLKDENNSVFNSFDQFLKLLTLELISVVALDQKLNCIDERLRTPKIDELVKAVDDFITYFGELLFSVPIYKYYPTKTWKKFVNASDTMFNTVREFVQISYDKLKSQKDGNIRDMTTTTILQQFILNMDKYQLSYNDVIALTSDFLLGGIDTTAVAVHFALYELGRNQEIQNILYEEIRKNVALNEEITEVNLSKIPFLKATLKETFRLHSVAPGSSRLAREDFILNGYMIPKGTNIIFGMPYIYTSERFFKDPSSFNPRRWLKGDKFYETINPYAYLPFGFGARQCIGRRLAEQEIYIILAKLINNFQIEYIGENIGYKTKVITAPDVPLKIKISKRV